MVEMRAKRNARNMPEGHFDEDEPLAIPVCYKEVGDVLFDFAIVLARPRRLTLHAGDNAALGVRLMLSFGGDFESLCLTHGNGMSAL